MATETNEVQQILTTDSLSVKKEPEEDVSQSSDALPSDDTTTDELPAAAQKSDSEHSEEDEELKKYWKAVKDNPADFTGWTYLLQFVEHENKPKAAREAFSSFLARYPYCYGYWKKYADLEKRLDNPVKVREVFEKGVVAVPLSIDLWIHYIDYTIASSKDEEGSEHMVRMLFERAVQAAGLDFRSDKLWDKYISWERTLNQPVNVTKLFDKILRIPTQLYSHHYEKFLEHVKSHHPKEMLSLDEFLELRKEIIKPTTEEPTESADTAAESATSADQAGIKQEVDAPPGDDAIVKQEADAPPGENIKDEEKSTSDLAEEEVPKLKERVIAKRLEIHRANEKDVSLRWQFEESIRRPYFHVKPLERIQLKTWKDYLDFEATQGSHERTVFLYERCLIACALYEEFWIKYGLYMQKHDPTTVRHIYERGCSIHLPTKPALHLAWAAFEEAQGDFEKAESIVSKLEESSPGLVMMNLRRINLKRRQGFYDEVEQLYKKSIESTATSATCRAFYTIKYSRFLSKVLHKYDEAQKVLEDAIAKDKSNSRLLLQLVDLEYNRPDISEDRLLKVFSFCLQDNLPLQLRLSFSQRKLEILEELGSSIVNLTAAYEQHQKLLKDYQQHKKRKLDAGEAEQSSYDVKKTKLDSASGVTPSSTGTTNGGGVNYHAHPPPDSSSYTSYYNNSYTPYHQPHPPYPNYNYSWGGYGNYY